MTSEGKRYRAAVAWVDEAIAADMNPRVVLWSADEWTVCTTDGVGDADCAVGSGTVPMPDGLDECIKQVLVERGRVFQVSRA